jgi:hypothetical protein
MNPLIKLLYHLNRLALLALTLAFLSFFLITVKRFEFLDFLDDVVPYTTRYVPLLLWPVTLAMVIVLLLRFLSKGRDESIGFGDFIAGVLAVACQVAAVIVYRAQGNELSGPFLANIPDVKQLTEHASTMGILGVTALQGLAFILYWIANPDPKERE